MKTNTHTQCTLSRGNERQISYIPTGIAIAGRLVDLKEADGTWDRGWLVEAAHGQAVASEVVAERSRDYRKTREASDI